MSVASTTRAARAVSTPLAAMSQEPVSSIEDKQVPSVDGPLQLRSQRLYLLLQQHTDVSESKQ